MSESLLIKSVQVLLACTLIFLSPVLSACPFSSPVLLFDAPKNAYEFIIEVYSGDAPEFYINGEKQKQKQAQDTDLETIFRYTFPDWNENQEYRYYFRSEKCSSDTFTFRTFPDKKFAQLHIAVGSCLNIKKDEYIPLLDSILNRKPELMIWLGDNVYLKDSDIHHNENIKDRYRLYRKHPQLKKILATIPSVAIRDDHDYGPNDGDSSYALREVSNKIFRSFWYTSSMLAGTRQNDLFCTYTLGAFHFILTDNRSNRGKLTDSTPQTFGTYQLSHIQTELTGNIRYCNIILSGGQILNPAAKFENLSQYPSEYHSFLKLLNDVVAPTLILSGDRHHGEVTSTGKITEVTTSPIQSSIYVTREENTLRTLGPIDEYNFVLLDVNASDRANAKATIRFITTGQQKYPVTEFSFK